MECYRFHRARQTSTERIIEFVARLKSLVLYCNFTDVENRLRDQLVCGLLDHDIKTLLFKEEKLTYEQAYKIATAHESAEKNAAHTDKLATSQYKSKINALTFSKSKTNEKAERENEYWNKRKSSGEKNSIRMSDKGRQ